MRDLSRRDLRPELMDQPDIDPAEHARALRALARINRLSGSAGILWPAIRALAAARKDRPLRVLDVASGGGDVPVRLWHAARRRGLSVELAGCDRSAVALDFARQRANATAAPVVFFTADVLADDLPAGYDVVTCSLFLHHLTDDEAVRVLARLGRAAGQLVLVNDLRRCRAGFVLAYAVSRVLTRSPVVHFDAPQSVAAAFTPDEVRALASRAGLGAVRLRHRWPFRWLMEGRPG